MFVEIGSEGGEGSTLSLANFAAKKGTALITVDIDPLARQFPRTQKRLRTNWQIFYHNVRDSLWPVSSECIEDLPQEIQNEIKTLHNWPEVQQHLFFQDHSTLHFHPNITWVNDIGSKWTANYGVTHGSPISLLYLDNFDYIWDIDNIDIRSNEQIDNYDKIFSTVMNNQNCQVEHLSQLINLYDYFTDDCVVGLDDTYQYNDCWVGKSGPGVVYLLSRGWTIIEKQPFCVFLRKQSEKT